MTFSSYNLAGPDPNPMTTEEVVALKSLVAKLIAPDPLIIQIGAERGCSTLAILEEKPESFIFSIDIGERPEEKKNLQKAGLPWRRVVRLLGRSQNIGLHWPSFFLADLIYVDGDHRYSGVYDDVGLWLKHAFRFFVIHDYIHPRDRGPHIQGRVWEAVERHREQDHFDGWNEILRAGRLIAFERTIPSAMQSLAEMAEDVLAESEATAENQVVVWTSSKADF